jgi:Fur family ferric uptake transcriptional regulator
MKAKAALSQTAVSEIFREFLKKKNHRITPERFVVLNEIYSTDGHFDADELFLQMKAKGQNISRATVYNTLELLVESNLVNQNSFGHKHLHYERIYGYQHHDHIICTECGRVVEFSNSQIEKLQEEEVKKHGFIIDRHTLQIFGICNRTDCDYKVKQAAKAKKKS